MKRPRIDLLTAGLVLSLLILAACGGETQDSEARVATRVAEDRAVAATLTAEATTATGAESVAAADAPTTEVVAQAVADPATATEAATTPPTATATPIVATVVPVATAPAEPTATSPPTATSAPPPTPTPIVAAVIPTDGSQGDGREILIGDNGRAILLPGIATAASPVVFDDFLTARVAVFDDRLPEKTDGNGIAGVTFEIVGPPGQYGPVAYERVEANAAFCLFGGDEPLCPALDLNSARNQWPDGLYDATITIVAEADNLESVWFWQFCVRTCETTQVEDTQAEATEETVAPTATSAEAATVPPANELAARIAQVGPGSTYAAIGNALAFQVEAFDPAYGSRDGDGIEEVNLEIFGPDGGKVYGRTERNAAYCAFAGGEPDCNVFEFTVDDSRWPDTDNVVRAGPHRLFATVYAEDGRTATVEMTVQLE